MSIGAGIIAAVPLQEIDNAPHAQASAQSHNKGMLERVKHLVVIEQVK